jgi:membrane protein
MDLLAPIRAFDRLQRRVPPLAILIAMLKNFSDQGAGNGAALIAYWAFFSIFPLLLLFASILGLVLHGDPEARRSIEHSVLQQFPIIGKGQTPVRFTGTAFGVGIAGTLLAGLGVTVAAQNAFNRVYALPHREQPNFFISRWRGLKLLAIVGVLQIVSTLASGLVGGGLGGGLLSVAGIALSLALDLLLFFIVFRVLIPDEVATSELWPGILLAAAGWEVLQAVGGVYIGHVVRGASNTYGTFATVIGVLTWLYLGARVVMYAAEINVTLTRGLWPRSIMDPPTPADRKARAMLAKMEERDDKETVEVAFHPPYRSGRREDEMRHPPYAVAPAPEPGERARVVSAEIAQPDLHTMTLPQVLDAIERQLELLDADTASKRRARRRLASARRALASDGSPRHRRAAGAARALALAAQQALGLAPVGKP